MGGASQVTLTMSMPQVKAEAMRLAAGVVAGTTQEIAEDCNRRIQDGAKTGRLYRYGKVVHQASAPGEAPATDTGFLANSIEFFVRGLTGVIAILAEYGACLEFGTSRVAARPYLRPSVRAAAERFYGAMAEIVRLGSLQ